MSLLYNVIFGFSQALHEAAPDVVFEVNQVLHEAAPEVKRLYVEMLYVVSRSGCEHCFGLTDCYFPCCSK